MSKLSIFPCGIQGKNAKWRRSNGFYSNCQKRLLQNWFFCHPERSEGSQPSENTRFFASLRMTIVVNGEFCNRLNSHVGCALRTMTWRTVLAPDVSFLSFASSCGVTPVDGEVLVRREVRSAHPTNTVKTQIPLNPPLLKGDFKTPL